MTLEASTRYRERHPDRVVASQVKFEKAHPGRKAKSRRKYKEKHRPEHQAWTNKRRNEWRANPATWGRIAIQHIWRRARELGRVCTITAADIVVPEKCPVLGIPIICAPSERGKHKGPSDNSPSVDCFDNSGGYTPDNIRVISFRANTLKRDATIEELERVIAYMRGECVF